MQNHHTPRKQPAWVLERLNQLSYDSSSGEIIWVNPKSPRVRCGEVAGTVNNTGYRMIGFSKDGGSKKREQVHLTCSHIAWYLFYGEWPTGPIDHIDGNRLNNRIVNLRVCTSQQNNWNAKKRSDNTTGEKGISFINGKWRVRIYVNRKRRHIGYYDSMEEAVQARDRAYEEHYGEFARTA